MRQSSRILVLLLVVIAAVGVVPATVAGQSTDTNQTEFPITLTDATGTEVTITERPERVTTTNPSAAQVMWELDAESQVVGLSKFAHYLDGAESRQNVSSTDFGVSIERVVDTEPDLVLAPNSTGTETVERLRETGLTVYHFPEATDFADVKSKTLTIGQLTGNEQAAVETNRWVDANVEAVSAVTADADRPRLMYPLLSDFAVGGGTFIDEIISASGAENVAAEEFDGYKMVSDETVITLDPEVVIVTDQTEGRILTAEPYSLTTAGQTNQSVFLEVNYINQPAPRSLVYSTRNLTAQLHPGLYNESDFVSREAAANMTLSTETDTESEDVETNVTETGPDNTTSDSVGDETGPDNTTSDSAADETGVSTPGFGVTVAVVSLIGGSLLARRRTT
jgi:iron complex transport system substrate-binding protein